MLGKVHVEYRSEEEQLIDYYLETRNQAVLDTLVNRYGKQSLLKLGEVGYKPFCESLFWYNEYRLFNDIEKARDIRELSKYINEWFTNSGITETSNIEDLDSIEGVLAFLENADWYYKSKSKLSKSVIEARMDLFVNLVLAEKENKKRNLNYEIDLMDAFVKNRSVPIEELINLVPKLPRLSISIIKNIYYKLLNNTDIFGISYILGSLKDILMDSGISEAEDIRTILKKGIDLFLKEPEVEKMYMSIFTSINTINQRVLEYRKEELILFFERFVLEFQQDLDTVKETVFMVVENNGLYPMDTVYNTIADELPIGLAWALQEGTSIRSYPIVRGDRFLMNAIETVERAFQTYVSLNILPEDWLIEDTYYKSILEKEKSGNRTSTSTDTIDFDLSEILEGFD